jgi:hypothetical protein
LSWRKKRLVLIDAVDQRSREIREILSLCKPSELRGVVEAHIEQALDLGRG